MNHVNPTWTPPDEAASLTRKARRAGTHLIVTLLLAVLAVAINAWTFATVWSWFLAAPTGVLITLHEAAGIWMLLRFAVTGAVANAKESKPLSELVLAMFARNVFFPLLVLALAWTVHHLLV